MPRGKTTLARNRKGGGDLYLINDVSRKVNLSQRRIRAYEKEGFIKPLREENTNCRLYSSFDISQIRQVKRLIHEHGFTLACLRKIMVMARCWDIFACPKKEQCPAFQLPWRPCYEVPKNEAYPDEGRCSRCPIYLNRNIKKEIILK